MKIETYNTAKAIQDEITALVQGAAHVQKEIEQGDLVRHAETNALDRAILEGKQRTLKLIQERITELNNQFNTLWKR